MRRRCWLTAADTNSSAGAKPWNSKWQTNSPAYKPNIKMPSEAFRRHCPFKVTSWRNIQTQPVFK
ncbi:hypothetical protein CIF96_05130 [Neisseria gonorrhoeae]